VAVSAGSFGKRRGSRGGRTAGETEKAAGFCGILVRGAGWRRGQGRTTPRPSAVGGGPGGKEGLRSWRGWGSWRCARVEKGSGGDGSCAASIAAERIDSETVEDLRGHGGANGYGGDWRFEAEIAVAGPELDTLVSVGQETGVANVMEAVGKDVK
jgi:hypothetical protein